MAFEYSSLRKRSTSTSSGAGYTGIMLALKSDLLVYPEADDAAPEKITQDLVFAAGKTFIPVFSENEKIKLTEEGSEGLNSSYNITLAGFYPGDDANIRSLVNDLKIGEQELYAQVTHCTEHKTLMIGLGECCPAMLQANFDSGDDGNPRGWTITIKVRQDGASRIYEGIGSATRRFIVAADDATPDVSKGAGTYILPENTVATEITALDNAVAGQNYVLEWNSTTQHSTISNGGNFMLASAFTPATGARLYLQAVSATTFAERSRYIPA